VITTGCNSRSGHSSSLVLPCVTAAAGEYGQPVGPHDGHRDVEYQHRQPVEPCGEQILNRMMAHRGRYIDIGIGMMQYHSPPTVRPICTYQDQPTRSTGIAATLVAEHRAQPLSRRAKPYHPAVIERSHR
jgi:hypothetical protein